MSTPLLLDARHIALTDATLAAVVACLEAQRKRRGMSCPAMCARTGITPRFWRMVRSGKARTPVTFSIRVLLALCAAVGTTFAELSADVERHLSAHPPTLPPTTDSHTQPPLPHTERPTT